MSTQIVVALKVRPLIDREKLEGRPNIYWSVPNENQINQIDVNTQRVKETHFFDHVFNEANNNKDIFCKVVQPIVDSVVNGINGTVFAYGQTSSGKTHTMVGDDHDIGITRQAVEHIFQTMKSQQGREFLLRASYVEIYNEKVNDLLKPVNADLKVREEDGQVVIKDVTEEVANSSAKVIQLMLRGEKNRRIAETNMNERSSRSHTIFRLIVESREAQGGAGDGGDGAIQVSHLNLVDLAGSEKTGQMNATADRFKEGCSINLSLTTLGKVIRDLSEGENYINYRGSNLTRILQSSLGGNALTAIVCTVTPAAIDQTTNTIKFAQRAKTIKNQPKVNEVLSDAALIKRYSRQLSKLQLDLAKSKSKDTQLEVMSSQLREKDMIVERLQQRIDMIQEKLINSSNTEDYAFTERARAKRRQTWCASGPSAKRMSLFPTKAPFPSSLQTVFEESFREKSSQCGSDDSASQSDFETPLEDFEQQLMEFEQAGLNDFPDFSLTSSNFSSPLASSSFVTVRRGTGTGCEARLKTQVTAFIEETRGAAMLETPPTTLRLRATHYEHELSELITYTQLEKETIDRERDHKEEVAKLNKEIQVLENKVSLLQNKQTDLEFEIEITSSKHLRREEELRASLDEAHAKLEASLFAPHLPETVSGSVETSNVDLQRLNSDKHIQKLKEEIADLYRANEMLTQQLHCERSRVAKLSQLMENSSIDTSSFEQSRHQDIIDITMDILNETTPSDSSSVITAVFDSCFMVGGSTISAANDSEHKEESEKLTTISFKGLHEVDTRQDRSMNDVECLQAKIAGLEVEVRNLETSHGEITKRESEVNRLSERLPATSSELIKHTVETEILTRLDHCKNDLERLKDTNTELEAEVRKLSVNLSEASCELTKTVEEREAIKVRLEQLELEKLLESNNKDELETRVKDLTEKLVTTSSNLQKMLAEYDEMTSLLATSKLEQESLKQTCTAQVSQIDELSGKLTRTIEEREGFLSRLEESEMELETLRENSNEHDQEIRIKDLTDMLEIMTLELNKMSVERDEISSLRASSEQELVSLREKSTLQGLQVDELSSKLAKSIEEYETMISRLNDSEKELEKLRKSSNEDELKTRVQDLTDRLEITTSDLVKAIQDHEAIVSRLEESEKEVQTLRESSNDNELKNLVELLEVTSFELASQEEKRSVERAETLSLCSSSDQELELLQKRTEKRSVERAETLSLCSSSDQELELLQKRFSNQGLQLVEMSRTLVKMIDSEKKLEKLRESTNKDELKTRVQDLTERLKITTSELAKTIKDHEAIISRLEECKKEVERLGESSHDNELKTRVQDVTEMLQVTTSELAKAIEDREAIVSQLEEYEKELKNLQEHSNEVELKSKVKDLTEKSELLSLQVENMSLLRASSEHELESLREKCTNQASQVDELSVKLAITIEAHAAMMSRLKETEQEVKELRESSNEDELKTRIGDLTERWEITKSELAEAIQEREASVSQLEESKKELEITTLELTKTIEHKTIISQLQQSEKQWLMHEENELEARVKDLTEKLVIATSELGKTIEEREAIVSRLEESEEELQNFTEKSEALSSEVEKMSVEREEMSSLCASSEHKLELLRKTFANQASQVDELSEKLSKTINLYETVLSRLEESEKELKNLQEHSNEDELKSKVKDLTEKSELLSLQVENMSLLRASSEHELESLREKCTNQASQVDELSVKLTITIEEHEAMMSRLKETEQEVEELRESSNEDELKTTIKDLTERWEITKSELAEAIQEREASVSQLEESKKELEITTLELTKTIEEHKAIMSQLQQSEKQWLMHEENINADELEARVKDLTEKLVIANFELGKTIEEREAIVSRLEESEKELQNHTEKSLALSSKVEKMSVEREEMSSLCASSECELELLREKCANQAVQVDELLEKLAKTVEHEAMLSRLKETEKELVNLRENPNEQQQDTKVKDLTEKLEQATSQLEEHAAIVSRLEECEKELEYLQGNCNEDGLQTMVKDLTEKLELYTSELTKISEERDAAVSRLEQYRKEVENLREKTGEDQGTNVRDLTEQFATLSSELNETYDAEREALSLHASSEQELISLREKCTNQALQVDELSRKLANTVEEREAMISGIEEYENEVKTPKESNSVDELEARVKDLSEKLELATSELAKTIEERQTFISRLHESEKELEKLREKSNDEDDEEIRIQDLTEKLELITSELAKTLKERDAIISRLEESEKELENVREKNSEDQQDTEMKDLTETLEITTSQLEQHKALVSHLEKAEKELENCREDELEERVKDLTEKLELTTSELTKTNEEREAVVSQLEQYKEELENLREKISEDEPETKTKDLEETLEVISSETYAEREGLRSLHASSDQEMTSLQEKCTNQTRQVDETPGELSMVTIELAKTIESGSIISQLEESKEEMNNFSESAVQDVVIQETNASELYNYSVREVEKLLEENVMKDRQLEVLSEKLSLASFELIKTRGRQETLDSQLEISVNELKQCTEENNKFVSEIESLMEKLSVASTQLAKTCEEREAIASQLRNNKKEVNKLRDESVNQETVIKDLLVKLSTASCELVKSRDNCEEIKTRLQKNVDELQNEKVHLLSRLETIAKQTSTAEKSDAKMVSLLEEMSSYKASLVKEIHCLDPTFNIFKVSTMGLDVLVNLLIKTVVEKQLEVKREYNSEIESLMGKLKQSKSWTDVVEKENEKLQSDLSETIEKNTKLALELKLSAEELKTLIHTKASLKESLNRKDVEIGVLMSELANIRRGLKEGEKVNFGKKRTEELEAILDDERVRYEKVMLRCDISEKQVQDLLQNICKLTIDLEASERKCLMETQMRIDLESKLAEVQSTIDSHKLTVVKALINKFETILGQEATKDDQDIDSLVDSITFVLLNTQNKLSGLQQSFAEFESNSNSRLKLVEEQKSLLESQLKNIEGRLINDGNAEIRLLKKDLEGITSKYEHLEITNTNLELEMSKLSNVIKELEGKLLASENSVKLYSEKAEDLQSKLLCNEEQLECARTQVGQLEATIASSTDNTSDAVTSLQKELEKSYADYVVLEDENSALKRTLAKANDDVESLKKKMGVLAGKYESIVKIKHAAELQTLIDSLQERLEASEKRNTWLDEENDVLQEIKISLEEERKENHAAMEELRCRYARLCSTSSAPSTPGGGSSELAEAYMRVKELDRNLVKQEREHKQEVLQLRYKLRESETRLVKASEAVRERDELRSDLDQTRRESSLKDEEVASTRILAEDLERRNRQLRGELNKRETVSAPSSVEGCECEMLRARLARLQVEHDSRRRRVAKLELQIEVEEYPYKKRVEEAETALQVLRKRNNELKTLLRKSQAELNSTKLEECAVCIRKSKAHDKAIQTEPCVMSMTSVGSGIVREHSFQEMQRQCNMLKEKNEAYKRVARDRLAYITQLETEKENDNPNFKRKYQTS